MAKNMKKNAIALLVTTSAFCGLIGFNLLHKDAKAELSTTGTFEMVEGTSVKISDQGGIRFRVKMDETVKNEIVNNDNVELKFLITGRDLFEAVEDNDFTQMTPAINETADESKIYQDGEFWYANGVVNEIAEHNREVDYMCLTYITDGVDVRYATVNGVQVGDADFFDEFLNVRGNLYDVVNSAFLHVDYTAKIAACTAYNTWYGTEDFPVLVHTADQYNYFVSLVNADVDFGDSHVLVLPSANASGEGLESGKEFPVNTKFQHTVSFYDGSELLKSETLEKGEDATAPTIEDTEDDYYTYTFNGWKDASGEVVDLTNVSGNITAYADITKALHKEGLNTLLKMDSADSLQLFGWVTQNVQVAPAEFYEASGSEEAYVYCSSSDQREYWINLGSLYQVKDIHSISVDYYATWSWGDKTAVNLNGRTLTAEQYEKFTLSQGVSNGGAVSRMTKTFMQSDFLATGMSENDYLEKLLFDNYGTSNWGLRICNVSIVTVEDHEREQEEKIANFHELLKMQTEESLALWTSGSGATAPAFKENSSYVGNLNAVAIKPTTSAEEKLYTLDLLSLYKLEDIESITFTYGCWAYDAYDLYFCVNGVAIDAAPKLNIWQNAGGPKNSTMTVTQEQILNSGVALDDVLQNVVFRRGSGTMNGEIFFANITINLKSAD